MNATITESPLAISTADKGTGSTLTVSCASAPSLALLSLTVVVPMPKALSMPVDDTVAMSSFKEVHTRSSIIMVSGVMV